MKQSISKIGGTLTTPSGKTINIPTNWAEITLSQYIDYLEKVEPKLFEQQDYQFYFWVECLAHFSDLSVKDLQRMGYADLMTASELLHFVVEPLQDFEAFKESHFERNVFFMIGGQRYSLPESLPSIPMTDLPFADFADSMDYWRQGETLLQGKLGSLPKIMSILVKKDGDEIPFSMKDRTVWIDERAKFWEAQTMDICWQFLFFFLKALQPLPNYTAMYLEKGRVSTAKRVQKDRRKVRQYKSRRH